MSESNFYIPSNVSERSYDISPSPSPINETPAPKQIKRGPRGGVYDPFPMKVHRMLEQTMAEGFDSIVSWLEHGRAFKIHEPKVFAETVMPRFFNQSKFTSFQRQLNLYGFNRASRGRDAGAYHHDLFLRGKPSLATRMFRQKVKGNGHRTSKPTDRDPDFYSLPPLTENSKEDGIIPNVFAPGSRQYLPITAVAPLINQTVTVVPPSVRTISSSSSNQSDTEPLQSSTPPDQKHHNNTHVSTRDSPNSSASAHATFIDELNRRIFMEELAMGCSILCQLRNAA